MCIFEIAPRHRNTKQTDCTTEMSEKSGSSTRSSKSMERSPSSTEDPLFKTKKSTPSSSLNNSSQLVASALPELVFTNKEALLQQIAQVGSSIQKGHVELQVQIPPSDVTAPSMTWYLLCAVVGG